MQAIEEVAQPEGRVPAVGLLVLEAKAENPHLVEQRGAVDLFLLVIDLDLLGGHRERPHGGEVLADTLLVEAAKAAIRVDPAGAARGRRVEVPADIEVRSAEVVDGAHERSAPRDLGMITETAAALEVLHDDALTQETPVEAR